MCFRFFSKNDKHLTGISARVELKKNILEASLIAECRDNLVGKIINSFIFQCGLLNMTSYTKTLTVKAIQEVLTDQKYQNKNNPRLSLFPKTMIVFKKKLYYFDSDYFILINKTKENASIYNLLIKKSRKVFTEKPPYFSENLKLLLLHGLITIVCSNTTISIVFPNANIHGKLEQQTTVFKIDPDKGKLMRTSDGADEKKIFASLYPKTHRELFSIIISNEEKHAVTPVTISTETYMGHIPASANPLSATRIKTPSSVGIFSPHEEGKLSLAT